MIFYYILKPLKFITRIVFKRIRKVLKEQLLKISLASGEEKYTKKAI